jgi:hypothetical protein
MSGWNRFTIGPFLLMEPLSDLTGFVEMLAEIETGGN